MRPNIDLVVQREGGRWVVRVWVGPIGPEVPTNIPPLGSYRLKSTASAVAIALAKHKYRFINAKVACEVYWRGRNGQITDRNTYGHDPERSVG